MRPTSLGTVREIRFGILMLPKGKRRTRLEQWFEQGVQRLPAVGGGGGDAMGVLFTSFASGRAMPIKDSLIAACSCA